tara:strand:+ start:621 stop:2741 length:2121 start_codon:yes stop_codon:yes gene_type:complete
MNNKPVIKERYRSELDGLRALAVVAVIINHFNKNILESGYLGVDIFFVISGYVITSSIINKGFSGFKFFVSSFYTRRIKRLLPALMFYILPISLFIWILDPMPKESFRTGITSMFGISNLYLFSNSVDYFANSTELNPFTHTWSLSVEEQFYLIFPIIFWLCNFKSKESKVKKNLLIILFPISILSLLAFIVTYNLNQPAAYFLMPLRFWEIAFGSISYLIFIQKNSLSDNLKKINPNVIIFLIFIIFFSPLSLAVFSTVLIVFLTCILIFCLTDGTFISKLFKRKEILFIGKRSYSLYLWHWGVLSLSKWTIGITWWTVPIQIILILLLSIISYSYVENPLRHKQFNNGKIQFLNFFGAPFFLLIILLLNMDLYLTKYIHKARIFFTRDKNIFVNEINPNNNLPKIDEIKNTTVNNTNCRNPYDMQLSFQKCITKNKKANNLIAMFGDSMNGSLLKLGESFYNSGKFNIMNIHYQAQIFPIIKYSTKENKSISFVNKSEIFGQKKYFEYAIKELEKERYSNKIILITNDFNFYFHGRRTNRINLTFYDQENNIISKNDALEKWLATLKDFVEEMNNKKIKVVVIGSMPSFPEASTYTCFYRSILNNYVPLNMRDCIDDVNLRRQKIGEVSINKDIISIGFKKITNLYDNFLYFDPTDILCKDKSACKVYDGEKLISTDGAHFSNNAASELYFELNKQLIKKKFLN